MQSDPWRWVTSASLSEASAAVPRWRDAQLISSYLRQRISGGALLPLSRTMLHLKHHPMHLSGQDQEL
jgi:hypothetical protein